MEQNDNSITAEQYKVQMLKNNFARRIADYEDLIADLQTRNAMLEQSVEQFKAQIEAAGPVDGSKGLPEPAVEVGDA